MRFCPGAQRAEACPDPTARSLGGWRRPICFRTPPRTSHLQPPGGGGSWGQTSWGSAREPEIHSPEVPKGPDCRPTDWRAGEGVVCYTPVRGRQGKACVWVCVCAQSLGRVRAVHGISQARILEWVAFPSSRGSSNPGIEPWSPALRADSLPAERQGKPKNTAVGNESLLQWIFRTQKSNRGFLHWRRILY